jgi:hypothetical protein
MKHILIKNVLHMKKINLSIKSTILLWIVRITVVIVGVFFMGDGCKDPISPEEAREEYAGTWVLTYSSRKNDSIYIHHTTLTLNADSTFSCTASFFMKDDSTRLSPLQGKWNIDIPNNVPFLTNHPKDRTIGFSSDSIYRFWEIYGDTKSKELTWFSEEYGYPTYTWDLIQ